MTSYSTPHEIFDGIVSGHVRQIIVDDAFETIRFNSFTVEQKWSDSSHKVVVLSTPSVKALLDFSDPHQVYSFGKQPVQVYCGY